jgi:hypothetical protein
MLSDSPFQSHEMNPETSALGVSKQSPVQVLTKQCCLTSSGVGGVEEAGLKSGWEGVFYWNSEEGTVAEQY